MQYSIKKSLGQHFLKDDNVVRKIVTELLASVETTKISQVLEVGPGAGALTRHLLQLPLSLRAVELDTEKVAYLQHTFPEIGERLITDDFLSIDPPFENDFIVIGNFPYNISTQIVFKVLEWKNQVPVMIGMFQKEVAQRIAAGPGSKTYGILSVLTQAFYSVEYLFDVPPQCFTPPPKVMSGVIRLNRLDKNTGFRDEKRFFTLVKTAFNQRRKMMRNAVKSLFEDSFLRDEIFNKRAEQLTVADFAALTFNMK